MHGLMTREEQIAYNDRHRIARAQREKDVAIVGTFLAQIVNDDGYATATPGAAPAAFEAFRRLNL